MTDSYNQTNINLGNGGGGGGSGRNQTFSVNTASVDSGYQDGSVVLRTGSTVNPTGAFTGGGGGNKSIFGAFGFNQLPIGSLSSVEYVWENVAGPTGPFFIPPGAGTPLTPYVNLIVDFDPLGAGDIRVLALIDDSLAAAITASIGTYVNNGSNELTYSWDNTMNTLIVLAPPNPVPGGVAPDVSVGASWFDNSYRWADLVAANPSAILVDAYPADGGMPSGAILPSVLLVSGDSSNLVRSGKRMKSFTVNGSEIF